MMNRSEDRNIELSKRISADLRNRSQIANDEGEDPDFEEDSAYLEETEKTGRFAWFWIILIVLAIASLIFIIFI